MKSLKIKVCGMRETQNILDLANLQPDFMGFIFYDKSPRNVLRSKNYKEILNLPKTIKKTGVFVDETLENIVKFISEFNLDYIQLHGSETPDFCKKIKSKGVGVIKAFGIDKTFSFKQTVEYEECVDFFLFDSKGEKQGGNGFKFDWAILKNYNQKLPFLLAGGIALENMEDLIKLEELNIAGIDVNSKFEILPGLKDISTLKLLFQKIRSK